MQSGLVAARGCQCGEVVWASGDARSGRCRACRGFRGARATSTGSSKNQLHSRIDERRGPFQLTAAGFATPWRGK
eukprot:12923309-Alexandrium_andersonii.AAC.1